MTSTNLVRRNKSKYMSRKTAVKFIEQRKSEAVTGSGTIKLIHLQTGKQD